MAVHSTRKSVLDQLVHPPSTSLLCSICQDIFDDPVINPACSHSFCRICIYQAVQMANRCPLCRAPLSNDKVHPNLALAGLIGDLRAWCRYRELGCTAQLALDDIAAHEKSCSFAPLNCPHAARGCKVTGNQRSLAEHLRACPYEMFRDFLDAIDRKYELLEKKIDAQAGEIAGLRSALARGGHSNVADSANALLVVSRPQSAAPSEAFDVAEVRAPRQVNLDKVECLATIANAHTSGVTALCPAQVGGRFVLYTGSHDAKIKVWDVDVRSGESRVRREVDAHKYTIWGLLRLSPEELYSASADGNVFCWDAETLARRQSQAITHPGAKIYCMTGANNLLYTGSADRSIRVWDTREKAGVPVAVMQGHTRSVWSLKIPPPSFGENVLLSAGNCGNVNIWDLRTWKARVTMNFENNEALSVECSPDGRTVFAGAATSKIYAFDALSGEFRARLSGHQWEVWQLEAAALAPGCAPLLASGSYDHTVGLWSLEGPFPLRKTLTGHKGAVHALRSVGGRLFSGSGDKSVRIWGEAE
jgi:WD40 repeat protein